jgi:hypothetical protein
VIRVEAESAIGLPPLHLEITDMVVDVAGVFTATLPSQYGRDIWAPKGENSKTEALASSTFLISNR